MGRDNNFSKAVKELLNNDQPPAGKAEERASEPRQQASSQSQSAPNQNFNYYNNAPRRGYQEMAMSGGNETYITRDTVITGTISSKANIQMNGQMMGDITTEKDVHITGKVDGNVDGDNIVLADGAVIGDLTGKSDVLVDSTAVVIGNVTSDNIDSDGRIKGSVKVGSSISLKSNAVVFGNITSRSLSVQDGAILRGNVQIISPRLDDEDLFSLPRRSAAEEAEG